MVRLFSHWWFHVTFHAYNFRLWKASNENFFVIPVNMLNHAIAENNNTALLCRCASASTFNFSDLFFPPNCIFNVIYLRIFNDGLRLWNNLISSCHLLKRSSLNEQVGSKKLLLFRNGITWEKSFLLICNLWIIKFFKLYIQYFLWE